MKLLRSTWLRLCSLFNCQQVLVPNESALSEKAIVVAGQVSIVEYDNCLKASCPVCSHVMCAPLDSDMKMIIASHVSLWHPLDVKSLFETVNYNEKSNIHVPSFVLGFGVATAIGVLLAFMGKNLRVKTRDFTRT